MMMEVEFGAAPLMLSSRGSDVFNISGRRVRHGPGSRVLCCLRDGGRPRLTSASVAAVSAAHQRAIRFCTFLKESIGFS